MLKTKLYQENEKWIKKLIEEGYEILDLGDTHNLIKSVFYEMEKQLVFGN